jgi:long-subunit fatty acid transport protein
MIKKLVIVLVAFFAIQSYGQQGTASPYSFYGIGTLKFKGTVENRSMGGLSIYTDSIHVNLRNPAAYASPNLTVWNKENRPIKFSVGASNNSTTLKANSGEAEVSSTTFDYLALSMPLGKFGFGFGLVPYSAVGYKLEDTNEDVITNRYSGEGGVNRAFLGLGYSISDKLSVGVDMNYNFGNIQNTAIEFVYDDEGNLVQYQSRESNRSDLSGLNFNIGLTYKTMINEKLELQAGLTYSPKSDLSSINERSFSTIVINASSGQEFLVNEVDGNLEAEGLAETNLTLPSRFSFGAGIGKPRAWFVGGEYTRQNTSEFANPIVSIQNSNFENASNVSFGGFFIPDYNSFGSYWKRLTYRAGFYFENTGLVINEETINEFGISFGVGLPVGNVFSNANLGVEYGKRGTTNQNLIEENFLSLKISLTLNDRWFEKRKYN